MTIKELHDATAALGFEDTLESSAVFFAAANRALYCANRIRPKTRELEITASESEGGIYRVIGGEQYLTVNISERDDAFLCYTPSVSVPVQDSTGVGV